jgi:hypothetical protein
MSTIVTRAGKGSPLTHTEVDSNFTNLNTDKYQSGNNASFGTLSASGAFSANGGATLGDASGDALTINSSAVSIPNGLNFDSNTLVIDATNNRVGVGTPTPLAPLDCTVNADGISAYFRSLNSSSALNINHSSNKVDIATGSADVLSFSPTGTERMRITSTGNLGIGTTSPASRLQIDELDSGNSPIALRLNNPAATGAGSGVTIRMSGTNLDTRGAEITAANDSAAGTTAHYLAFATSAQAAVPTERMRIDSSGNLVVGGTTAIKKLTVAGGGGSNVLAIQRTTTNSSGSCGGVGFARETGYFNAAIELIATSSTSGDLVFRTEANSTETEIFDVTERMRINSSGDLGIGTTSPARKLQVVGSVGVGLLGTSGTYAVTYYPDTSGSTVFWNKCALGSLTWGTGSNPYSGGTELMRINSSGNLLVGTTSSTPISGGMALNSAGFIRTSRGTTTTAGQIEFANPNGVVGSIQTTGSVTAYNISSDRRLKENITPLTTGLSTVLSLKPSQYNYKADPSTSIQGFIADELQQVVPHAVSGEVNAIDENGNPVYQGVDASFLIPHLVSAIQELKAEVNALKLQINQ